MEHLIKHSEPLELYAWLDHESESPGWDVLTNHPFITSFPGDQFTPPQHYFAEYHLEYHRQRFFDAFPSRLHSSLLFATCTDAVNFSLKYPQRVYGKELVCARSSGEYKVSFHDSSFTDYLRLPHSLDLSMLEEVSSHYWNGTLAEEIGLAFMDEPWWDIPVIEAIFQGRLLMSFVCHRGLLTRPA